MDIDLYSIMYYAPVVLLFMYIASLFFGDSEAK